MKSSSLALVAAVAPYAAAYPAIQEAVAQSLEARQQNGGFPEPDPGFNAEQQYVSNEGQYKFVAPDFAAGDVRGPCPGLNALGMYIVVSRFANAFHIILTHNSQPRLPSPQRCRQPPSIYRRHNEGIRHGSRPFGFPDCLRWSHRWRWPVMVHRWSGEKPSGLAPTPRNAARYFRLSQPLRVRCFARTWRPL